MYELTVKTLDSQNHSFTCEEDITVRGFKEHIADTVSVVAESQRLIYCGRVLQDDKKLSDYGDVNGKVIHLVQRAPPQPESRSNNTSGQRQNNDQGWTHGGPRVQYRGHVHRNAMYVSAMSVPTEIIEGHGIPAPQLSNTLSNSRLVAARRMLNKATQLMDRLDDPSQPLHPSPTENNASESVPPASAPDDDAEQDSDVNNSVSDDGNRTTPGDLDGASGFSAAALINIRLSHGNNGGTRSASGSVNLVNASDPDQSAQAQAEESPSERSPTERVEQQRTGSDESESERAATERPDTSANTDSQSTSRRSTPQVPRPSQMAELLERLVNTQDRLRPYIERYRVLMSADPSLTPGSGPEGVTENQRIVDGVSESLHYLSHACHALSDIIVDMGQQPPRNLRCRPIIIQHSAILQAGIPIQVESHFNIPRNAANNNNTSTDEGNEATRPSSPTSAASDQTTRSSGTSTRPTPQSANGNPLQSSFLGTLLNLPNNVELSMELSPHSTMDLSSPGATDGSETDQGQSNNNNNGGSSNASYSLAPPFAIIRDALQRVFSERNSQMDTSGGSPLNSSSIPTFVTIVGQQMDLGTPNSGQSTQARSNIGTHPTTSTQTRSTARPHVLHPHSHPPNVGVGMSQSLEFDPFLPCNSHHVRRGQAANSNHTSTSQSNAATSTEGHNRSQAASQTPSSSGRNGPQAQSLNFTIRDANIARELFEGDNPAFTSGLGLAMSLGELLQGPVTGDVHVSLIGSGPGHDGPAVMIQPQASVHLSPGSDISLAEFLRPLVPVGEYTGQNFLVDLRLFLLRNITFDGLRQMSLGQASGPLVSLRRPLREFLEQSFPNSSQSSLQDQVVEQIISHDRLCLQLLVGPDEQSSGRRVDIPATIEALLRKFCKEFLKLLFNNDLDDTTFANEAIDLAKKLEDQSSAILQHILRGGQTTLESIISRFINQLTEGIHPALQHVLLGELNTRIRAYATRSTDMPQSEIESLLVYKEESSTPSAGAIPKTTATPTVTPVASKLSSTSAAQSERRKSEEGAQAQAIPKSASQQAKREKDFRPEPMETDAQQDERVFETVDLANGEEIPESFPGSDTLPPEWVPIIARDSVRQRKQAQMQALQGGPLPFSDAYLNCLPSKRRKLVEQQRPQLLVTPGGAAAAANGVGPIGASVERLVREGMAHSRLHEAEGAARAVALAPGVRSAFGQAIRECLQPARLATPDFPNSRRFPNASKYFAPESQQQQSQGAIATVPSSSDGSK